MAEADPRPTEAPAQQSRADHLAAAYANLETALEQVDLADEPDLAEQLIEAVEVTGEAYNAVDAATRP